MKPKSPRQELGTFTGSGNLRQAVEDKLSPAATDLLITVVLRYCERRSRPRHRPVQSGGGK